jgi:uroporphyrinogen-III decarboxylase
MVDSRERALSALHLEEADRTPMFELLINSPVGERILGRTTIYGNKLASVELLIKGERDRLVISSIRDQIELYQKLNLDVLTVGLCVAEKYIPPRRIGPNEFLYTTYRAVPGELYVSGGFYSKARYNPESDMMTEYESTIGLEELPALEEYVKQLESEDVGVDASQLESVEYARKKVGDDMLMMAAVDGTFPVSHATWLSLFLRCIYQEPDLIRRLIHESTRRAVESIRALVNAGVEVIWGGSDWAFSQGPFFSPKHFREFILPSLKEHVRVCHKLGVPFVKHTDGNVESIEQPFLVESGIDGYHAIEPRAGMDIARLKRLYGDRICLLGNVDCAMTLVYGSIKDVIQETKRCIRAASPGGGHILSSSNSIHSGINVENFLTMLETNKKFGKHPVYSC